jgi:hypothetical protein
MRGGEQRSEGGERRETRKRRELGRREIED